MLKLLWLQFGLFSGEISQLFNPLSGHTALIHFINNDRGTGREEKLNKRNVVRRQKKSFLKNGFVVVFSPLLLRSFVCQLNIVVTRHQHQQSAKSLKRSTLHRGGDLTPT